MMEGDYSSEIRSLRSDVDSLEYTQSSHSSEMERLTSNVSDLEVELSTQDERIGQVRLGLDRLQADHDKSLKRMSAAARQFSARLALLEQHLSQQGGAQVCDLDEVDGKLRGVVELARQLDSLQAATMASYQRDYCQTQINNFELAQQAVATGESDALKMASILATTAWTSPKHQQTAPAFRMAMTDLEGTRGKLSALRTKAGEATRQLADDDRIRSTTAPQLARAQQAAAQLYTRLHTRLVDAQQAGMLLPPWFSDALGVRPMSGDAGDWAEVAVDVMVYRVLNGITDPISALGPPSAAKTEQQSARREQIAKSLRGLVDDS